MFRGFHIREARLVLALLGLVFTGVAVYTWQTRQDEPAVRLSIAADPPPVVTIPVSAPTAVVGPDTVRPDAISPSGITDGGVIDLNRATASDLELLPGIGPAKSAAILETRERLGGFRSIDDLLEVHGIGIKTLEKLRPYLAVGEVPAGAVNQTALKPAITMTPAPTPTAVSLPPVRVNYATSGELESLKGIGPVMAERILQDRALNGPFRRPEDLLRVKGIGPTTVRNNLDRLVFD